MVFPAPTSRPYVSDRDPPDLARQRREEGPAQGRLLVDERDEVAPPSTCVVTGSSATAVADLGAPSSRASSPKNPPGRRS